MGGPARRRTIVTFGDGFAGLRSVLPPPSRRALVLVDPSYEDKQDYRRVIETLEDAFRRFATGTYAVWYPQVSLAASRPACPSSCVRWPRATGCTRR